MSTAKMISGSIRMMGRYKLRTFFMSIGIVLGVAALIVAKSVGSGVKEQVRANIQRQFSADSIMISAGHGMGGNRAVTLKMTDIEAVAAEFPRVANWDAMQNMRGVDVSYKGQNRTVMAFGYTERGEEVWGRGVTRGDYFSLDEVRSASRVTLIGDKLAAALFGDADPVGEQITVAGTPYRVKGVLQHHGVDPHGWDRDEELHVPLTTMMRRLLNVDHLLSAKLIVDDVAAVEEVAEQVESFMQARHSIGADEPNDFSVFTTAAVQRMAAGTTRIFDVFLPVAAGIALLVAAIVIANIMLIAVRERTAEIGLRKAIGATDGEITRQFLAEVLAIAGFSAIVGTVIGIGLTAAAAKMMSLPSVFYADAVLLGVAAALLVGVLAGLLPARRAARLNPIEALR